MRTFLAIPLIGSIFLPSLSAQSLPSNTANPPLHWKYGWRDGTKANTLGSPSAQNPLPQASSTISTGYSPAQIAHAYGFDAITGTGAGQKIAIVVAYGSTHIQSDLNTFCAQYGLPTVTIGVVYPQGTPSASNSGWAGEASLDVEWAHAMAPAASITLVVAPSASLASLLSAVQYASTTLGANVVSMSWGAGEFNGEALYDAYFSRAGTAFVAASGDTGSTVLWPGVSTNVLSIGGTSLNLSSSNTIVSETGWTNSGGGVSAYEATPAFQAPVNSGKFRSVPDLSYVADPYTGVSVYFTDPSTGVGGWYVFGGTSVGAPQWAALLARRASSVSFQGLIYGSTASAGNYAKYIRDIVSGSNGHYTAKTGYDLVTGLGSPLASADATLTALPSSSPTASPSPTPLPTPLPSPTPATYGIVQGWGMSAYGQLTPPSSLTNAVQVAGGDVVSGAVTATGSVVVWGWNIFGQTNVPAGVTNAKAIALGATHGLALLENGTVHAWGNNVSGQAVVPSTLTNAVQISAAWYHSLALTKSGKVVAWGSNGKGESTPPSTLTNATAVTAGAYHSLALTSNGTVVAWGSNGEGESRVPPTLTNAVAIAAGAYHSVALTSSGSVVAWGGNTFGQLKIPAGLTNVVAIAAGDYHTVALTKTGSVIAWGENAFGQTNVPATITNAISIGAGVYYSLGITPH